MSFRWLFVSSCFFVALPGSLAAQPAKPPVPKDGPLGMKFVPLPKATFYMGWNALEGPAKPAEIKDDFEIAIYTTTQSQWQQLMGKNPSYFSRAGGGEDRVKDIKDEDLKHFPVEQVSWNDVQLFVKKLNEIEKGKGYLYRLPSGMEWEYACRGAATTKEECSYHFYLDKPTNDLSSKQANFFGEEPTGNGAKGPYLERTAKVGSYAANKIGLYDMHGNLVQWCENLFEPNGTKREIRGSNWSSGGTSCRSALRFGLDPIYTSKLVGFRLVRVPVKEQPARPAPKATFYMGGGGGKDTELAKLAAGMKPGTWAELTTANYTAELLRVQNGNILGYTDTAVWHPKTQQVLFVGQGHYAAVKFIIYSAATNSWKLMPTPVWWDGDAKTGKGPIGHAYQNNTIDTARGILFHHQSATRLVHRYDIAKDEWTTLPEIKGAATGHGTALAYFPERKGLVRVYGGAVYFFDEEKNTWSLIKHRFPMGPYHNIAKYNAVDKSVIFGAGNGSKQLHRMDAQGIVTPLKDAPVVIRISSTVTAIDPVSGDLLVVSSEGDDKHKFHALDLKKNEWRQLPDAPISEGASASIDAFGVTLYFANRPTKVFLYKHR